MTKNPSIVDKYKIAPGHDNDLEELEPIIFQGVAYSPLKADCLINYNDNLEIRCNTCN